MRGSRSRSTARGVAAESFKANLLFEPWEVKTQGGAPFKVFTAFWRACRALPPPGDRRCPRPRACRRRRTGRPATVSPTGACCRPRPTGPAASRATWTPGEAAREAAADAFPRRGARATTARRATCRRSKAPRACRRISPSARSARGRSGSAATTRGHSAATREIPGRGRLARIRLPPPLPLRRPGAAQLPARVRRVSRGSMRTRRSKPGGAAAPAIRSSMPACASCGRPAGCTTACA